MTRKQFLIQEMKKDPNKYKFLKPLKKKINGKLQEFKPYVLMSMKEKYLWNDIYNIGILDIETSSLTGDFGFMITYVLMIINVKTGKKTMHEGRITESDWERAKKENNPDSIDSEILKKLMKDLSEVDYVVGHWFIGKHRHDIPFIRSRCAINRIPGFPKHKMIRYGDTQRMSSQLHRFRNNGLGTIADAYELSTHKTPIKTKDWKRATMFANKKAIDYILHHNVNDVKITAKVLYHLEEYIGISGIYA